MVKSRAAVYYLILAVFFLTLVWYHNETKLVSVHYFDKEGKEQELRIPQKDRKQLLKFMQILFAEDSFAYTVLGNKPISWSTFDVSTYNLFFSRYSRTLRKGCQIWEKYQSLFPVQMYREYSLAYPNSGSILIINQEQVDRVVSLYKEDFETILGIQVDNGNQLIRHAQGCSLMYDLLKGHQGLIGTLLGYGRDNAWDFQKAYTTHGMTTCVWDNYAFEEPLDENLSEIEYSLYHYSYPSFAGNPLSSESIHLKNEYLLTRRKILDYYSSKGDFLEATLSLLAGYKPTNSS